MRFLCLLLVFGTACVAPTQHNPTKYGTVKVAFGPALDDASPWRPDQVMEITQGLRSLEALGPSFVTVSEGDADIVIRRFISGKGCTRGVGRFAKDTRFVECDPDCTHGYLELRACVEHELGHWLGMSHVCVEPRETADCSPVGYGYAIMNPRFSYGDSLDDLAPTIGTDVPTSFDLAEFKRTHP